MIKRRMDSFWSDKQQLQELAEFILAELGETSAGGQAQPYKLDYSEHSSKRFSREKKVPKLKRRKYQEYFDSTENFEAKEVYEEQITQADSLRGFFHGEPPTQGKASKIAYEEGGELMKTGSSLEKAIGAARMPTPAVLSRELSDFCCRDARRYDCGFERY